MSSGALRYLQKQMQDQMVPVRAEYESTVPEDEIMTRYYREYGAHMTPEAYENLQRELGISAGNREKAYADLDYAESQLGDIQTSIDGAWASFQNTFQPVRVVNGMNVEATYYLPPDVIESMNNGSMGTINTGDGSYVGNWVDDGAFYNVDVTPQGGDDSYGKELHEMIGGLTTQTYDAFLEKAGPEIQNNIEQKEHWQNVINTQREAISLSAQQEQDVLDRTFNNNFTDDTRQSVLNLQIGV